MLRSHSSFCVALFAMFSALACAVAAPQGPTRITPRTLPPSELKSIFGGQNDEKCGSNFSCVTTSTPCTGFPVGQCGNFTAVYITGQGASGCFLICTPSNCYQSYLQYCRVDWSCQWNVAQGGCVNNQQVDRYEGYANCTDTCSS